MRTCPRLFAVLLLPALCAAGEITGTVLYEDGKPVAGAEVLVEIGKAHYALTPEWDRWIAVDTRTANTDAEGRFTVTDAPDGAVATASVKGNGTFGVAQGAGPLEVKLAPAGTVKGKVIAKGNDLKQMRIYVVGGMGLRGEEGEIDKRTGTFEVKGLAPGPGRVHVKRGNWDLARHDVEIVSGKATSIPNTKPKEGAHLPTVDPEVEVTSAKLVDADGDAMPGVQLIWSSQWMDGGMDSDKDGVVLLAGGGVRIGGPPYLLRLKSLRGKEGVFEGALKKTQRNVAIVEIRPLAEVKGTVAKGAVEKYVLVVVGPGDKPQVYTAQVEDGKYTVHLPRGKCRFVLGTVDGKTREHAFEVAGGGPIEHEIALE